jgi:hypothetical protein
MRRPCCCWSCCRVSSWRSFQAACARLARRFPLDLGQPYYRLLADRVGASGPAVLRVIPYSFTVDEPRHRGLAGRGRWSSANRRN